MSNLVQQLCKKGIIKTIPSHIPENIHYLTVMGSEAYGVATEHSDFDCYGFSIPDKKMVFPHLDGKIHGYDEPNNFEVWTQHHLFDKDAQGGQGREYDFSIYSIIKYFKLLIDNNPNMLDSLFVPMRCILFITPIGQMVRDNRKLFISKKCWFTHKGYAFQQVHKMKIKDDRQVELVRNIEIINKIPHSTTWQDVQDRQNIELRELEDKEYLRYHGAFKLGMEGSKRFEMRKIHGMDVKFGYHVVRLLLQAEQILEEGDEDLERNREVLKSIRRGEWTVERIEDWFQSKEKSMEALYNSSKLQHSPDKPKIKELLLNCLEAHFGDISTAVHINSRAEETLQEIKRLVERY